MTETTAEFMRQARAIQRRGILVPTATAEHMPFKTHRTVAQWDGLRRRHKIAAEYGYEG